MRLWGSSGLTPADIDVGILYDHFTPFVLMQLEEFGFCGKGEAADFMAEERLPVNTHGGQLGEAYLHGMNGIAEGVRQLRGTSVNQIPGGLPGPGDRGDRCADVGAGPGGSVRQVPWGNPGRGCRTGTGDRRQGTAAMPGPMPAAKAQDPAPWS